MLGPSIYIKAGFAEGATFDRSATLGTPLSDDPDTPNAADLYQHERFGWLRAVLDSTSLSF